MRPLHLWLAALLPLAVGLTGCSQAKRSSQTSGEQPTTAVSISQPVASQPVASRSVTPTSQPVAGSQPTATPKTTASKPVVTLDPGPAKQTTKHKHETKHRPLTPREERRVVRKHSTRGISHGERFRRRPAKARGRRRGGSDGHAFAGLSARPVPKAEPKAAPPPISAAGGGIGTVTIEPTQAKVGTRIAVRADSPFPENARIKLGGRSVKTTRSDDGRTLRFRIPAGAKSGYVTVVVGDHQHASRERLEID